MQYIQCGMVMEATAQHLCKLNFENPLKCFNCQRKHCSPTSGKYIQSKLTHGQCKACFTLHSSPSSLARQVHSGCGRLHPFVPPAVQNGLDAAYELQEDREAT